MKGSTLYLKKNVLKSKYFRQYPIHVRHVIKDRLHVCLNVLLLHFCIFRGFGSFINEMKVPVLNTGTCTLKFEK